MEYRDNLSLRTGVFRGLLAEHGFKSRQFKLYRHDVAIKVIHQDKDLFGSMFRKGCMANGMKTLRHNSPLYRAWLATDIFHVMHTEPQAADYFSPTVHDLQCEIVQDGKHKLCRVDASMAFETTDSLIPIRGSDYYAVIRSLYLQREVQKERIE